MDYLFSQTRFSGIGQEKKGESGSGKDQSISPQKTESFKDKKKGQSWIRRQFSRQMSQDYDSNGGDEYTIAVAAAAYVISSLQETGTRDQTPRKVEPRTSITTTKSTKEDRTILFSEPDKGSKRFPGESSELAVTAAPDMKKPEKALPPAPTFKKPPSSVDKQPGGSFNQSSGSFRHRSGTSKPDLPASAKPARTPSSVDKQPSSSFKPVSSTSKQDFPTTQQSSARPGMVKAQADIWEETELAGITERYEKQKSTIHAWEEKKKKKAKRRLDNEEREVEAKRAKAMERYQNEMKYIDQAAGGARAKADEKKRNNVIKVKERANIFRRTGKVPKTCLCF